MMIFFKRSLMFSFIYAMIVFFSLIVLFAFTGIEFLYLAIAYFIMAVLITLAFVRYYKQNDYGNIWHMPVSQSVLYGVFCLALYLWDFFGFRHSSGFMDFGVGFEIALVIILAAVWIIPSLIAAAAYSIYMKKRGDS